MSTTKTGSKISESKTLQKVPVLKCTFIVPTEDKKGVYLIINNKGREAVYQVDGLGSEYCRQVDGSRSSQEIAEDLIKTHDLPEDEFKEYVAALQEDLHENGLLSFQRN